MDTHTTRVYGLKVAEHLLKVRGSSADGSEINREKDQALAAMGESVLSALALESLLELIGCVVADLLVQSKNENSVVISSAPCGWKDSRFSEGFSFLKGVNKRHFKSVWGLQASVNDAECALRGFLKKCV